MNLIAISRCTLILGLLASADAQSQTTQPELPSAPSSGLHQRPPRDLDAPVLSRPVMVNGRAYTPPTERDLFVDYLRDSYGWSAFARSTVRTAYNEALDQPKGWGTDPAGFAQRFGSNVGITAINGTVRYGMEEVFHEDLRYIPCHGCNFKHKVENALFAEFTARHDSDGHRFFTLTPTIADFSGPIIARQLWYPVTSTNSLVAGLIATRTVFATRVGAHLFREFIMERQHKDKSAE